MLFTIAVFSICLYKLNMPLFVFSDTNVLTAEFGSAINMHSCQLCSYSSPLPSNLKRHMLTHSGQRNQRKSRNTGYVCRKSEYFCSFCDFSSILYADMKHHLLTHNVERRHACPICECRFVQKYDLKRHMRIHTGERPFVCTVCDYRANLKGNLVRHMRTKHNCE